LSLAGSADFGSRRVAVVYQPVSNGGFSLQRTLTRSKQQEQTHQQHQLAQECFRRACTVHKWYGAVVGVVISLIVFVVQGWLPDYLKAATPESKFAAFGASHWVPVLVLFILTHTRYV
jgi:hypothetical protein